MSNTHPKYAFMDQPIEIGIDEAGRGPVLGPMVYGCSWWPVAVGDKMRKDFGFNDSKQVKEEDRERMFEKIKELDGKELGWAVNSMSSQFISERKVASPSVPSTTRERADSSP